MLRLATVLFILALVVAITYLETSAATPQDCYTSTLTP